MPDAPAHDPILEAGGARLAEMMARGEVSAVEVMEAHLDRIEAVNDKLIAVVSQRPREALMAEAREADAARIAGRAAGPLHGLPIAVKDLVATKGLRTTMGSPLFADQVPEADGLVAKRLREAGAILVGKTNVPEFGLGSHTMNEVFGTTANPWNPARSAGGSSGGAAVALATRMLPIADGSDMMGSLRNPAGWNNVMGFRPTWGRVPNSDSLDLYAHQLATEGPMGRSVADVALLLDALAGFDPAAPLSLGETPGFLAGVTAAEPRAWARDLRIGWIGDWNGTYAMDPGVLAVCEKALAVFEGLGAHVEPLTPEHAPEAIWDSWCTLRSWAMAGRYAEEHANPNRRTQMKPEAVWEVERGLALSALDIHRAVVARADWHRALQRLFARFDLLALPSAQVWPFPIGERWPAEIAGRKMDTYHRWMEVVLPASLEGAPAICVPAGFSGPEAGVEGLPMGLQLIGPRRADLAVLRAAAAFETAAPWVRLAPPDPV